MWSDWWENHPARKIIVERDLNEVDDALIRLGLEPMSSSITDLFSSLKGNRIDWKEWFNDPEPIWNYLLPDLPFDFERHAELVKMNIQPADSFIVPDAECVRRNMRSLQEQCKGVLSCL